jgi:hypothetical protein
LQVSFTRSKQRDTGFLRGKSTARGFAGQGFIGFETSGFQETAARMKPKKANDGEK